MNFRQGRNESPEVNLTPLIDVVFLLLIFFMVSTTFERSSELAIELPEAGNSKRPEPSTSIDVAIDHEGAYYVNGRELVNRQFVTLREALERAAGGRKSPPVVVDADARAPYQAVVSVMDAARVLGFARLRFSTRQVSRGE